jgi:periplasmic protein TonB
MFEHSLIDLESKPRPRRRWISLPIAVGLHVVGFTTFAFASYWNVADVPEPSFNIGPVTMLTLPEPPSGGGGRPTKPPEAPEEQKPPVQDKIVQPTEETIPTDVPPPTTETPSVTEAFTSGPSNENAGPSFGDGFCPDCAVGPGYGPNTGGNGDGSGPAIGTGETGPIHITLGMTRPQIVHQVQPRYTELARRSGVQGTVIVEAVIDENGNVTKVRVLRGLPMGLDKAAVEAIQQWRFKPATLADKPVKVFFTLTVNFTIQR